MNHHKLQELKNLLQRVENTRSMTSIMSAMAAIKEDQLTLNTQELENLLKIITETLRQTAFHLMLQIETQGETE